MTDIELTQEHRNVLKVLRGDRDLRLREIHDALVAMEESRFQYSPEFGSGWNDERRELRNLRDELSDKGLVTNDYQTWSLTPKGREQRF